MKIACITSLRGKHEKILAQLKLRPLERVQRSPSAREAALRVRASRSPIMQLPDTAGVLAHHGLAGFASERLLESR